MHENYCIDGRLKSYLTNYTSVAPRIYGLPKIHKNGSPLRPVISCLSSWPKFRVTWVMATLTSVLISTFETNFHTRSCRILCHGLFRSDILVYGWFCVVAHGYDSKNGKNCRKSRNSVSRMVICNLNLTYIHKLRAYGVTYSSTWNCLRRIVRSCTV